MKNDGTRIFVDLADFKGMERGFSRIWRIFADFADWLVGKYIAV